jgi:3-oxoacyl-[acyl-carrier protein] reductase
LALFDLSGKTCLVVGASGYLGSQICVALIEQGAKVVGFYHQNAEGVPTDQGKRPDSIIQPMQLDITDADQVFEALAAVQRDHERIDALICAAGGTLRKLALVTREQDVANILDLNFKAVTHLCRMALRPMLSQASGRIVLIGSIAGASGLPGQSIYSASKAAVHAYGRALAREVGYAGITVNVIAPGALTGDSGVDYSSEDQARARTLIGLRRLGSARDVAIAAAFLVSDEAAYISGAVLAVDGAAAL